MIFPIVKAAMVIVLPMILPFEVGASQIEKDFLSDKVIGQQFKSSGEPRKFYFYARKNVSGELSGVPDYWYLWHGRRQSGYDFLNTSGLIDNNLTLSRQTAVFMALDGGSGEHSKDAGVMEYLAKPYKAHVGVRNEVSVGYDTGVSTAYRFACKYNKHYALLSSGGLDISEDCQPEGLNIVYVVNDEDPVFPYSDETIPQLNWGGGEFMLSAKSTEERLVQLLGCTSKPVHVVDSHTAVRKEYQCKNSNSLTMIDTRYAQHQWNGFVNAKIGEAGYTGYPHNTPVGYWLNRMFSIN